MVKGDPARSKSRPSSSSFAASLVSGSSSAGFGGYVGSSKLDIPQDNFVDIDGETAANIRRLSKKDPTTKLKALAALRIFFQGHSANDISPILQNWIFEYKKLVQDNNRQVREATHKAMASLLGVMGRSIAPYLRSVMGAWWVSQFDPFHEVSETARQAFQIAFPVSNKQIEALHFCVNDIVCYFDENLRLTPQTISEKNIPIEESTEKHERVISSCLLALAALLEVLFSSVSVSKLKEEVEKSKELISAAATKLCVEHKLFQNFLKSNSFRVRSAVYESLKSYIQYVPDVLASNMEDSVKCILGAFVEKEPSCHRMMWEMVISFSRRFPQAWQGTSAKKIIYPRFWAFLRHGCYGSQKDSYPCLLPFISIIPSHAMDSSGFFIEFFNSLWKGTQEGSWNYADGSLLLKVVKECLIWILKNSKTYASEEVTQSFQASLIETVVLTAMWNSYTSEEKMGKSSLLRSENFIVELRTSMVDLLDALDDNLLSTFWLSLRSECVKVMLTGNTQSKARVSDFFVALKLRMSSTKMNRVLNDVVKPFVAEVFPHVKSTKQADSIQLLSELVSSYGSESFGAYASISWQGSTTAFEIPHEVFSLKHLQYMFQNDVVPWCLDEEEVDGQKLDLLLSFLSDKIFTNGWNFVLGHIEESSKRNSVLADLIDKLQERGAALEEWKSSCIDAAVLSCSNMTEPSCRTLLRRAMRGILVDDRYHFILSEETLEDVLQQFIEAMATAVAASDKDWAISVGEILCSVTEPEDLGRTYEMTEAAVEIILSNFRALHSVGANSDIFTQLLAMFFVLCWATFGSLTSGSADDTSDNEECDRIQEEEVQGSFERCLRAGYHSISSVCKEMRDLDRQSMLKLLMRGIANMAFDYEESEKFAADWIVDIFSRVCVQQVEVQQAINVLLEPSSWWPMWCQPSDGGESIINLHRDLDEDKITKNRRFAKVICRLGYGVGEDVLFTGSGGEFDRSWLAVELLCSGGESFVLPYLRSCAANPTGIRRALLDRVLGALFLGAKENAVDQESYVCWRNIHEHVKEPFLRGLLATLHALHAADGPLKKEDTEKIFCEYISNASSLSTSILPCVLDVLMPSLRKKSSVDNHASSIKVTICKWLGNASNLSPLSFLSDAETRQWMQVATACFPMDKGGGAAALLAASAADVSEREKQLLFSLLKKQMTSSGADSGKAVQLVTARVIRTAIGYCWQRIGVSEWRYILSQVRKWLEDAVVVAEEMTELLDGEIDESMSAINGGDEFHVELLASAVNIVCLVKALHSWQNAKDTDSLSSLVEAEWDKFEGKAVENVLRLLLATGLCESLVANSESSRDSLSVRRQRQSYLWDEVADVALTASDRARESAVRAADLWGVGKGAISALYCLLFTPHPIASLQWVAYKFLSTYPLQHLAVASNPLSSQPATEDEQESSSSSSCAEYIRTELLSVLNTSSTLVLHSKLSSSCRVHFFLAWSLFLSHIQILGTMSLARNRLVQFTQLSDAPNLLLDTLFQYIPLRKVSSSAKKKNGGVAESTVAEAAQRTAATGTMMFAVEALWGGGNEEISVLAGALYGLMLRVLPACVRIWFTGLREKASALAIEAFTTNYCSPKLLSEEFAQVQASVIGEENESLSIRASRSLREVTAVYKKEEASMDVVIKLPCSYPLRPVEVECTRRLGISETLLRKWIVSMASFLRNQNGGVAEAVQMWKKNVDREMEGVEECPICYSIIHTTHHTLPRLRCKTCKHKFHSHCLYKWFSTSHKSTCPLCQTPF